MTYYYYYTLLNALWKFFSAFDPSTGRQHANTHTGALGSHLAVAGEHSGSRAFPFFFNVERGESAVPSFSHLSHSFLAGPGDHARPFRPQPLVVFFILQRGLVFLSFKRNFFSFIKDISFFSDPDK